MADGIRKYYGKYIAPSLKYTLKRNDYPSFYDGDKINITQTDAVSNYMQKLLPDTSMKLYKQVGKTGKSIRYITADRMNILVFDKDSKDIIVTATMHTQLSQSLQTNVPRLEKLLDIIQKLKAPPKQESRDLINAEVSGILRESSKTEGLAPEGSALDRALASGILPQVVGQFLTSEKIQSTSLKPTIASLKRKTTGKGRKHKTSKHHK